MDEPGQRTRIFIADDNLWVRLSLGLFLEQTKFLKVVGETNTIIELIAAIQHAQPDILLIAWELIDGVDSQLIGKLRDACPGIKIVGLSTKPGLENAAILAGADAFVSKGDPPECLMAALAMLIS